MFAVSHIACFYTFLYNRRSVVHFFIHEPWSRKIGQTLPVSSKLNKALLLFLLFLREIPFFKKTCTAR